MKSRYLLLLIVFVPIVFSIFYYKLNPLEFISCKLSRGSYESLSAPIGSPPLGSVCVHQFSDGGRKCSNNDDCNGNCLITKDTILENTGPVTRKVVGGFGVCEDNDFRNPYYPGDFDNPASWAI